MINPTTSRTPQKAQSNSNLILIAGVVASLFLFWYLHLLTLNQLTQLSGGLAMPDSLVGGFDQGFVDQLRAAMDDDARGQLNYVHKTAGTLFPLIFGFTWLLLIGTNVARKSAPLGAVGRPAAVCGGPAVGQRRHRFGAVRGNGRRRPGRPGVRPHRCRLGAVRAEPAGRRRRRVPGQEAAKNTAPTALAPSTAAALSVHVRCWLTRWAMTSPAVATPTVTGYPISRSSVPGSGTSIPVRPPVTSAASDASPHTRTNQPSGVCRSHNAPSTSTASAPAMKYISAPV